jgi:hypothetical protein
MSKTTTKAGEREWRELDLELDRELEGTFPASDALKITLGRPRKPATRDDTPPQK